LLATTGGVLKTLKKPYPLNMELENIISHIDNPPLLGAAIVLFILFIYLEDEPQKIMREREVHLHELDGLWKNTKNPAREFLSLQDEISMDPQWKEAKVKYNIYTWISYLSVFVGIYAFFG